MSSQLHQLGDDLWAWMQPPGSWGETNAGLVRGAGESLLVDTLWDEVATEQLIDGITPLVEKAPIGAAFNSHRDGDHWWGNAVLPPGTAIWASQAARSEMSHEPPPQALARLHRLAGLGLKLPGPVGRLARYSRNMLDPFAFGSVRLRLPEHTFDQQANLTVGGRAVHVELLGPAHTAGDAVVHVPDAGVVFAGDLLFIGVTPVIWQGPVEGWIRALRRLLAFDAETYVPGHGTIGTRSDVEALLGYWEWLAAATDEQAEQGRSAAQTMRTLARSPEFAAYRGWVCPERLALNVLGRYRDRGGSGPPSTSPPARISMFSKVAELQRFLNG